MLHESNGFTFSFVTSVRLMLLVYCVVFYIVRRCGSVTDGFIKWNYKVFYNDRMTTLTRQYTIDTLMEISLTSNFMLNTVYHWYTNCINAAHYSVRTKYIFNSIGCHSRERICDIFISNANCIGQMEPPLPQLKVSENECHHSSHSLVHPNTVVKQLFSNNHPTDTPFHSFSVIPMATN